MNQTIIDDSTIIESGKKCEFNRNKITELLDKWTLLDLIRIIGSAVDFHTIVFGLC